MNYMMIRTDDMLNGDGLRVVLFCTACDHCCENCHNQETWHASSGKLFDNEAKLKILEELDKDYISGITLSGGDPLNKNNLDDILALCKEVKNQYPNKNIWIYSGYTWDYIFDCENTVDVFNNQKREQILQYCDVLVDGKFIEELADVKYPWAGSTNQRIIDVQKSLEKNEVVLWSK